MNPKSVLNNSTDSFEQTELKKGQTFTLSVDVPSIVFNLSGEFFLFKQEKERVKIRKEEMICLSPGIICTVKTIQEGSICVLALPYASVLYYRYIRFFFKEEKDKARKVKRVLKMDPGLLGFLRTVTMYKEHDFLTHALLQIKAAEFFCVLKGAYRPDILSSFF